MSRFDPETELFAHSCPKTWQVISGRRYVLPNYRAHDYANQIGLINQFAQHLADFCSGQFDSRNTASRDAHLCNLALALRHNRPTYFLERELGQALMRTVLPDTLEPELIKWKFPQMRIMLPIDLLSVTFEGHPYSFAYLDIGRFDQGKRISFPSDLVRELELDPRISTNRTHRALRPLSSEGFSYRDTGGITLVSRFDDHQRPGHFLAPAALEAWPLIDIAKLNASMSLELVYPAPDKSDAFSRLKHLGLNILLFLSSSPPDPAPLVSLRAPRWEGKRFISGLYQARFVGDSQRKRLKLEPRIIATKIPKPTAGQTHAQHWVAGHWRLQPHGPGSKLRKLIWLQPYQTLGPGEVTPATPIT